MKTMHASVSAWLSLLGLSALVLAADVNVTPGKSSLIATFKQENVPVDAPFKKFSGRIDYDPAKPAAANAAIEVDMASLDTGDEGYNAEARKKSWFDTATCWTIRFHCASNS